MKSGAFLLLALAVATPCVAAESFLGAAVYADYAYAAYSSQKGCSVAVVDLSCRDVFRVASRLFRKGRGVGAPVVNGDALYLPLAAGIEVFDVSNPELPEFLCRLDGFPCGGVESVSAISNGVLSVRGPKGALEYSVSDPFSPVLTAAPDGAAPSPASSKIAAVGNFVIFPRPAADPSNGCELVSARIDGGTNLVEVFSMSLAARPTSFSHGEAPNLLFYATGLSAGLLEVALDGKLVDRGVFFQADDVSRGPLSVACNGQGLVALACRNDGVRIFSAKAFAAASVAPATVVATRGDARSVALEGNRLYVADGAKGAAVYDVDEDGLVSFRADYILPTGSAAAIAVDGANAFLACEETLLARLGSAVAGRGTLHETRREQSATGLASDIATFRRGGRLLVAIADGDGGVAIVDPQGREGGAVVARLRPSGGGKANIRALCVVGNAICAFDPETGPVLLPLPKDMGGTP